MSKNETSVKYETFSKNVETVIGQYARGMVKQAGYEWYIAIFMAQFQFDRKLTVSEKITEFYGIISPILARYYTEALTEGKVNHWYRGGLLAHKAGVTTETIPEDIGYNPASVYQVMNKYLKDNPADTPETFWNTVRDKYAELDSIRRQKASGGKKKSDKESGKDKDKSGNGKGENDTENETVSENTLTINEKTMNIILSIAKDLGVTPTDILETMVRHYEHYHNDTNK